MATPNPSPSPAEAPEIKSIKELQDKKVDALKYLQDMEGLSHADKANFALEYESALKALDAKTDAEKTKDIGSIKAELEQLKAGILNEKQDETEELDDKEDDETTDTTKQKLNVEKEIRGQLNKFKQNIENKLNAPVAKAPEEPKKPEGLQMPDVKFPEDWKNPPIDALAKNPDNKVHNNWLVKLLKWLWPSAAAWFISKANDPDYGGSEELKNTFESAIKLWESSQSSSLKRVLNIKHISKKELFNIMQYAEGLGLDLTQQKNIEAAFGNQHIEEKGLRKYHRIHKSIENLVSKYGEGTSVDYDPAARLRELLDGSKDKTLDEAIDTDIVTEREAQTPSAGPTVAPIVAPVAPTDAEKRAKEAQEIKSAQETDENLIKAQKELDDAKALPEGNTEKKEKVEIAEKKLDEAKKAINSMIELSKTKVSEILKKSEQEMKDLDITIEQSKSKAAEIDKRYKASGEKDKTIEAELAAANNELRNLGIKRKALDEAINGIKIELDKFPKDATKTITASAGLKAAQEAERLANGSQNIAQVEQTKEEKEKEGKEFTEKLAELKGETENTLYDGNKHWSIDRPRDVEELKKKLDGITQGKDPDTLKKQEKDIMYLTSRIDFAQAKIELIQLWKKKENEWATTNDRIDYDAIQWWKLGMGDELIEIDGTDIDVDIDGSASDKVLLKTTDKLVRRLGGEQGVLDLIRNADNQSILKMKGDFTSKNGYPFSIEAPTKS